MIVNFINELRDSFSGDIISNSSLKPFQFTPFMINKFEKSLIEKDPEAIMSNLTCSIHA